MKGPSSFQGAEEFILRLTCFITLVISVLIVLVVEVRKLFELIMS
jgi:hypothetical protein